MSRSAASKSPERDRRILEAARSTFLEKGVRGASMEAIAKRAGVAKPTLYAYYPDKQAVFLAVVTRFIESKKEMVLHELASSASVDVRIANALCRKYAAVMALLSGSPHARELMTNKELYAGEQYEELRSWLVARLADALAEAGRAEPEFDARLMVACAVGVHESARSLEELDKQIRTVVQRLLSNEG